MEVYLIYKKIGTLTPILYGFSDNKKLIKLFKTQRNMDRYFIVEHELSKYEWYNLNIEHPHYIMRNRGLITSISHELLKVDIAMTENEDLMLCGQIDNFTSYFERPLKKHADVTFVDEIQNAINIFWSPRLDYKDIEIDQLNIWIDLMKDDIKIKR